MNKIDRLIWYHQKGNFIVFEDGYEMEVSMRKSDMEMLAKQLEVEFVDYPKKCKKERGW